MFISKNKLMEACTKGLITENQAFQLLDFFNKDSQAEIPQKFNFETVLYYGGSIIALGAMMYYMHDLVTTSTYGFILLLSIIYSLIFSLTANYMWKKGNTTPAGLLYILFILSISYVALVITKMTGLYPHFSEAGRYADFYGASKPALCTIFVVTLICSGIVIKKSPLSILTIPVTASLYSIFLLYIPNILDKIPFLNEEGGLYYSLIFSLILLIAAYQKDRMQSIDYPKWMYLIGSVMLYFSFTGLTYTILDAKGHDYINTIVLLLFSFMYLILAILLQRKIFLLLGGIGFFSYLVLLETSILSDLRANSLLVITCVILTGLLVVFAGIYYKNNLEKIENFAEKFIPGNYRKNLPKYR